MSAPAGDFRTKLNTLSKPEKAAEWKRLGVKVAKADTNNPYELLRAINASYLEGSGLNLNSSPLKKPNKNWNPPTEPSALHKAFVEHADEWLAEFPLGSGRWAGAR